LQGLILHVPMCCDKCVEKVRKALEDLDGARDVVLDQYNQLVTIYGDVDPEKALRRVRRVKKRSKFWKMSIQPVQYFGSPAIGQVHSKSLVNSYRAPGYHTSAYRAPYTSSYSRAYNSPYIDSQYRSGYIEPRGVYGRFAHDDMEYRSRGTPYLQLNDI
jgi:copper chaperone CopZ